MNTIFKNTLLKTAFCCMASDGEIDPQEVEFFKNFCKKSEYFKNTDFQTEISGFINEINEKGKLFIQSYFQELEQVAFSEKENLEIIDVALQVIYADEKVEYSEVKFFKNIRYRLKISNDIIEQKFNHIPDIDTFIEQDIINNFSIEAITTQYLDHIELPQFDIANLTD